MIIGNTNIKILASICFYFITANFFLIAQTGKFYSPDKDLSNSLVNQVYQDKRGFIWIATENGLNRFDGTKFTTYKHVQEDSTSLKNNYVRTLFEDNKGTLWVGCINGLMIYDRATNSFREIKMYKEGKQVSPHITKIIETRDGNIWIATSGQGVFFIKNGKVGYPPESRFANMLNNNYLNLIFEDSEGNLWIGSENNGLNLYIPSTGEMKAFTAPHDITSNNISSIAEDEDGNIFIGTQTRGLNKYNIKTKKFTPIFYKENTLLLIKDMMIGNDHLLYIGTDGQGMKFYNKSNNQIEDFSLASGPLDLSQSKVHSIIQDKENNFWLGIFQKGVYFIPGAKRRFGYYGFKSLNNNPIGSSAVMSICKDKDGITWVGTDGDGIYGINDKGERVAHFKQTASQLSVPNIILSIFEDSNNNLWVGSYTKGLAKLDRRTGNCEYVKELQDARVYTINEDKNKNLLVGTHGSGFYSINLNTLHMTHYESRKNENNDFTIDELSNDWINDIFCDSQGQIWIAHYKGVSCFNPQKNTFINYLGKNNILPLCVAYSLYEDRDGHIWIGTSEGLSLFDKESESVKNYTTKNGLPSNVICGICDDKDKNIWISTYYGISKFIVSENRFKNYYAGDGLQGNEFTRGAQYQDKDGKIYFGGIYGITFFSPEDIIETKKKVLVLITDFYILNTPVKKGDKSGGEDIVDTSVLDAKEFHLAYKDNTFSIEFSSLEFSNPERIVYQYTIDELGHGWQNSYPGMNRITYTGLAPGTYTFRLRAIDHDSYSDIKTVKIIISPPWYLSLWAYIVYVLVALLLIYFVVTYIYSRIRHKQERLKRLHIEQMNEAKLQFFINISHEIRTPMTLIINPVEKLIKENKDHGLQKTYIMIYRNSQRILRLINQMMDVRKLDNGQMRLYFRETDIVGFIEDLMTAFEYQAQRKNINFSFVHDYEKLFVWIDLNNFDKVLLNILSNAFKYTPDNGNITIRLRTGSDQATQGPLHEYFEISVSDNGIGIDKDKIEQIFERFYQISSNFTNSNFGTGIGLHLARSLVELHHGVIFAENREDSQGTRFIIRLPLRSEHLVATELASDTDYKTTRSNKLSIPSILPEIMENIADDKVKMIKPRTKYKILIVEDEDEIRKFIEDELCHDYKIIASENGKKGLDRTLSDMPDLIICDVMMPEMDGITFSKKVRQNINISHIPIILLTAKSTPENEIEGFESGVDAYVTKPFSTDVLKSTIVSLIENRERLRSRFTGQQHIEENISKIEMKSADEILMQRILKIINENLSNPDLSVEMLAANIGMSRVHMHRKLKELSSQSTRDFIKAIRLKQAATLLASKKMTIAEVAYATGFSNPSHFSNSFREFYGMSPKEYAAANMSSVHDD